VNLVGKRAVVTGGGRGIGAAVARSLAAAGAAVLVAARTLADVENLAAELRGEGHAAWSAPCDVADPGQIEALARFAFEHLGGVDILVNNAGIAHSAPLKAISLDTWNRIFAVNVTGTFLCTQAFLPGMAERRWGRVINVASIAGRAGAAYIAAYSASKHAVLGFTRSVAAEVAASGVTVNAVCPGYVNTDMTRESVDRIVGKTGRPAEEVAEAIRRTSPQHRLLDAGEVAFLVLSLCDPLARGINGQAIVQDGGSLLA
jgi:NAD(P)-dependent dehydrogenase (short-subunit alcohol dehydrogenase family)